MPYGYEETAGRVWVFMWDSGSAEEGEAESHLQAFQSEADALTFIASWIWDWTQRNLDLIPPATVREMEEALRRGDVWWAREEGVESAADILLDAVDRYLEDNAEDFPTEILFHENIPIMGRV